MKSNLLIFSLLLFFSLQVSLQGQSLKFIQLERCVSDGLPLDSCFRMTDSDGRLSLCVRWEDLVGASDPLICDKIDSCLGAGNGERLCELLQLIPNGNLAANDRFYAKTSGGSCKTVHIDSIFSLTKLCAALNFPIVTYLGTDYLLVKRADGSCGRVLASTVKGSLWNCDSTKACIGGDWFCDSIYACLTSGVLCEAMGEMDPGTFETGDSIWVKKPGGECVLALIDDLIGGGDGAFNCDSVKACISGDWFCDSVATCITSEVLCGALGDLAVLDDIGNYKLVVTNGDSCGQIPLDSLLQDCQVEIEVGGFGGSPEGDNSWATSCDGGVTHTNRFWGELALAAGNTIELYGNSEGGGGPLQFDEVALGFTASIGGTACAPILTMTVGNVTQNVNLPVYTLGTLGSNITLKSGATVCSQACAPAVCIPLREGGSEQEGVEGVFQVPIPQSNFGSIPNISDVRGWQNIPRFRSHRSARKVLQTGDLYFVGRKSSLQVAR